MRPQRLLVTLAITLPAIAGLAACSSSKDATSPKTVAAVPAVDTVLADLDNLGVLEIDTTADTVLTFGMYTYGADQFAGWYSYTNGGADTSKYAYRPMITYNLPTLPGQGVVDSAKAYVWQCQAYGYNGSANVDPYTIGHVTVDHVNLGRVVESNATTFFGDTLQTNIGTISSDSSIGGKSLAVTTQVQADYNAKRTVSQYRLSWVFTTAPTLSSNYNEYYADLGSDCENTNGGPAPWLVIWSH
ncbi:MAG TPA: hypothetical protein VFA43_14755 [Gemmatimonadaceae bacterium]|nr:hypothetical protein [Gemmatimonadaceae bacterium]